MPTVPRPGGCVALLASFSVLDVLPKETMLLDMNVQPDPYRLSGTSPCGFVRCACEHRTGMLKLYLGCPAAFESGDNSMPEDALAEREATRVGTRKPHHGQASRDCDAEEARSAEEGRAEEIAEFNATGHTGDHSGLAQIDEDRVDPSGGHHHQARAAVISSTTQPAPPSLVGLGGCHHSLSREKSSMQQPKGGGGCV